MSVRANPSELVGVQDPPMLNMMPPLLKGFTPGLLSEVFRVVKGPIQPWFPVALAGIVSDQL
jgi:hypothetical protein